MQKFARGVGSALMAIFVAWAAIILSRDDVLNYVLHKSLPQWMIAHRETPGPPEDPILPEKQEPAPAQIKASDPPSPKDGDFGDSDANNVAKHADDDGDQIADIDQGSSDDSAALPEQAPEPISESAPAPSSGSNLSEDNTAIAPPLARPPPILIPVYQPTPVYPRLAQENRISGDVLVEVGVSPDGSVKWIKGKGNPILLSEAERTIRQWRYQPYTSSDQDELVWTMVTVKFNF
jgi:TonB family protein